MGATILAGVDQPLPFLFGGATGRPIFDGAVVSDEERWLVARLTDRRSSLIRNVAFDRSTDLMFITLENSRLVYVYPAQQATFLRLVSADSPGAYYNNFIRGSGGDAYGKTDVISTPRLTAPLTTG